MVKRCYGRQPKAATLWRTASRNPWVSNHARGGNRTHTPLRERDFKCFASIPKLLICKEVWRRCVKVCKQVCKFCRFRRFRGLGALHRGR
jgi:hypothetical protein